VEERESGVGSRESGNACSLCGTGSASVLEINVVIQKHWQSQWHTNEGWRRGSRQSGVGEFISLGATGYASVLVITVFKHSTGSGGLVSRSETATSASQT
jgi:hypothetical protein